MFKIRLISAHFWLLLMLLVVFIKIYQHNLYIKTMYEYQRLSREFGLVEKDRNELLVNLYELRQPVGLMEEAEKHGMLPLQLDMIVTSTQDLGVDFMTTGSTMQALERCGFQQFSHHIIEKVKEC